MLLIEGHIVITYIHNKQGNILMKLLHIHAWWTLLWAKHYLLNALYDINLDFLLYDLKI